MIFNKKIDKRIWLMLVADKQNNDNIIQFITNIPEELKNKILDKLEIFVEYKKTGVKNFSYLCGECDIDNRLLYSFEIDPYFEEIEMGYMECHNGIYRDVFKMTLYLGDNFENIRKIRKSYIGKIQYNINVENIDGLFNLVNSSENEYNLIETSLGCMVLYSKDNGKVIKNHFTVVDLSSMPEELSLEDIMDKKSLNVRRKKK